MTILNQWQFVPCALAIFYAPFTISPTFSVISLSLSSLARP